MINTSFLLPLYFIYLKWLSKSKIDAFHATCYVDIHKSHLGKISQIQPFTCRKRTDGQINVKQFSIHMNILSGFIFQKKKIFHPFIWGCQALYSADLPMKQFNLISLKHYLIQEDDV